MSSPTKEMILAGNRQARVYVCGPYYTPEQRDLLNLIIGTLEHSVEVVSQFTHGSYAGWSIDYRDSGAESWSSWIEWADVVVAQLNAKDTRPHDIFTEALMEKLAEIELELADLTQAADANHIISQLHATHWTDLCLPNYVNSATLFELGIAFAKGKKVVGYINPTINPPTHIDECAHSIVYSPGGVLEAIREIFAIP